MRSFAKPLPCLGRATGYIRLYSTQSICAQDWGAHPRGARRFVTSEVRNSFVLVALWEEYLIVEARSFRRTVGTAYTGQWETRCPVFTLKHLGLSSGCLSQSFSLCNIDLVAITPTLLLGVCTTLFQVSPSSLLSVRVFHSFPGSFCHGNASSSS